MKKRLTARIGLLIRSLSCFLLIAMLFPLAACQSFKTEQEENVARYGSRGRQLALEIAEKFPFRSAGSPEEKALADYLADELKKLGYEPEIRPFSYQADGWQKQSQNVILHIPGRGFSPDPLDPEDPMAASKEMQAVSQLDGRRLIYAAHYDTAWSRAEAEEKDQAQEMAAVDENGLPVEGADLPPLSGTDGLDDNAAAVAVLLSVAQVFRTTRPAYDIDLVFFGAGHDHYAGAEAMAADLSGADIERTDAMINLDQIYAGDRVYAHAGWNSVREGRQKDYAARRKLYECTDIYYDNLLLTRNGFALFTNQSGFFRKVPGEEREAVYREWSEKSGDHSPFDRLGIPIVFFDSASYDLASPDEPLKESEDPYFSSVGGMIGGSGYDKSSILTAYFVPEGVAKGEKVFGSESATDAGSTGETSPTDSDPDHYRKDTDRLEIRINNLAFILSELSLKAPPGAKIRD